ncbi:MAG TPA: mannose-1-phosphate guanylyltransferase [Tepidisphaeraceae bacterium]|jgi:mannose-1-phosphate guanylyltransferase|nr:mannose-1-phosphate guanylyltransferase [Tepidisphaeraceae bacterium]
MQYGLIMAGGAGTRLWPLSRKNRPKQLLPLIKGRSLLQLSYDRLRGLLSPEQIYVCTNAEYANSVFENLPELPRVNLFPEPEGRDTANAVGLPAAVLLKKDPDAVIAVVTADHVIEPVSRFQEALRLAFSVARDQPNALVTFGIVPNFGHTGLGYIHRGESIHAGAKEAGKESGYKVLAFKEKPDKATADRYVESGRYYWNSGMFVWRADTVLRELSLHLPEAHRGLMQIADAWNTPQQEQVLREIYPRLPKISIDYAVMEPASQGKGKAQVMTVEMPVEWLDVGSWPALADTLQIDEHDNAIDCKVCVLIDADNNIIISHDPQHLIATVGLSDMIVVHTPDVTLVCPKRDAQRVKELVTRARELFGGRFQ